MRIALNALLRTIFVLSGAVLLVDVAFFGPGIAFPGVPFSIRRALFLIAIAAALGLRCLARRSFTRPEIGLLSAILLLVVGWVLVIPRVGGYSMGHAIADASPWTALVLVAVWPWPDWDRRLDWAKTRKLVLALGLVLACVHVLIWALLITNTVSRTEFYVAAEVLLGSDQQGDPYIRIAEVPTGFRIFWSSSIFLLGCVYFLVAYPPRSRRVLWWFMLLLICFAMWATQIRAFLAALFIGGAAWPCVRLLGRYGLLSRPRAQVMLFWIAGVLLVSIAINPAVLQATGFAREGDADAEREEQAQPLLDQFLEQPVLGSGFGSYTPRVVRSDEFPFSYELTFYALLMKLGIGGMAVLVAALLLALKCIRADLAARSKPRVFALWVAFTTGLWFSGATNPMVTSFVGMAVLVLVFIDLRQQLPQDSDRIVQQGPSGRAGG